MAERSSSQISDIVQTVHVGLEENGWDDRLLREGRLLDGRLFASHRSNEFRLAPNTTLIGWSDVQEGDFGTRILWHIVDYKDAEHTDTRDVSAILDKNGQADIVQVVRRDGEIYAEEQILIGDKKMEPRSHYGFHTSHLQRRGPRIGETEKLVKEMQTIVAPLRQPRNAAA